MGAFGVDAMTNSRENTKPLSNDHENPGQFLRWKKKSSTRKRRKILLKRGNLRKEEVQSDSVI